MDNPASPGPGLTGIVLAGGRSMLSGQPKPLVFIGGLSGRLVLVRMFDALKRVCDEE